jgi:hypothetical protein
MALHLSSLMGYDARGWIGDSAGKRIGVKEMTRGWLGNIFNAYKREREANCGVGSMKVLEVVKKWKLKR